MKNMRWTVAVVAALGLAGTAMAQEQVVVDGSTTVGPIAKAFAEYYMKHHPGVNISVSESGSGNGAKGLFNRACDVASMSRPMKNSERASARESGINPFETTIALDGLVLIVHHSNPVKDLTLEQIRDIYAGKIGNWKELGGPDLPIVVISRDTNSGTYESFENLVLKGAKITGRAQYVGSNGAIRQQVMETPAAIGYVGLAFTEGVKPVSVNGVEATPETVTDKSYPIARSLFFYTNGRPKAGTALAEFVGLCRTPEGREIVDDVGFVSLPE